MTDVPHTPTQGSGLTLFVGTLTDYFAPALRRQAEAAGQPLERAQVQPRVEGWLEYLNGGLVGNGHLDQPMSWSEAQQEAYTHGLGIDALRALKLLLVHGRGCEDPPATLPDNPDSHPRWVEAVEADFEEIGFDQILVPELWLPGSFDFTFECPYPDGHEAKAGSLGALRLQLTEVGRTRLPSTDAERAAWGAEQPTGTRDLLTLARFAYSALDAACTRAETCGLPLLLHW